MKFLRTMLAGLAVAQVCGAAEFGAVAGRVALPEPTPIPAKLYNVRTVRAIQPADAVRAAVYLDGGAATNIAQTNATVELVQEGYQFRPALLVVRKGTTVTFPNKDSEYHSVLSYAKAKEFDLGRYKGEEKPPAVVFDKAGSIEVNCEIHAHMRAFVLVLETPYFTTTDSEGRYALKDVPPGSYQLKVWCNGKVLREEPVTVTVGQTNTVDVAKGAR